MRALRGIRERLGATLGWTWTHRHHVLFGGSLFFLTLLMAWWTLFLKESVDRERADSQQILQLRIENYASVLGHQLVPPQPDVLDSEKNISLLACPDPPDPFTVQLSPHHPTWCLTPSELSISSMDRQYRLRNAMVFGEGALSFLLILVTGLMLYRLLDAEKRASQELQEIWSRVTHEIKTPITGIKALLQTLEKQELSPDELRPLLKLGMREVERQEKLAENLLIGQRLARGFYQLQTSRLELVAFLRNYLEHQVIRIPREQVSSNVGGFETLLVQADPNALRVILDNLVENSVKYSDKKLLLQVFIEELDGAVMIHLKDNGPGFEPSQSRKVFDAYKRLSAELPKGKQGTGMGLHISRRLAVEMGGELTAESAGVGFGATFTLTLRVARSDPGGSSDKEKK